MDLPPPISNDSPSNSASSLPPPLMESGKGGSSTLNFDDLPAPLISSNSNDTLPPPLTSTGTLPPPITSHNEATSTLPPPITNLPEPIQSPNSSSSILPPPNSSSSILPPPIQSPQSSIKPDTLPAPITSLPDPISVPSSLQNSSNSQKPSSLQNSSSSQKPPSLQNSSNSQKPPSPMLSPVVTPRTEAPAEDIPPPPPEIHKDLAASTLKKNPHAEFEIKERIGKGSFGAVWRAIHRQTGNDVALKKCSDPEDTIQEIKIMEKCDNRNIIKYFGSYKHEGDLWIIMELCSLGSLPDALTIFGKTYFHEKQVCSIAKRLLRGLTYLHGINHVHRDIKPENILLNAKGEPKLADFGVAGNYGTLNPRSTLTGSPYYIAPEVLQENSAYDNTCDIWSLGVTLIELLQGQPPHFNQPPMQVMMMIAKSDPPTLKEPKKVSTECNHFLKDMLIKKFKDRPQAKKLLQHKWMKKAAPVSEVMKVFAETVSKFITSHGGLETAVKQANLHMPTPPDENLDTIQAEPEEWKQAQTSEGKVYYYGTLTKETSWTPPEEYAPEDFTKQKQLNRKESKDDEKKKPHKQTEPRTDKLTNKASTTDIRNSSNTKRNSANLSSPPPNRRSGLIADKGGSLKNLFGFGPKNPKKPPARNSTSVGYSLDPKEKEEKKGILSRFLKSRPAKKDIDKKILSALYDDEI